MILDISNLPDKDEILKWLKNNGYAPMLWISYETYGKYLESKK